MTSSPGSPEPRDHPERVVSTQPDTNTPVVRYRVLLHERRPPATTTLVRPKVDESPDGDTARPRRGRIWRWIKTNLAGDPPISASMTALALMVVFCYGAIMMVTVGRAAGIAVVAIGSTAVTGLYLAGRD